MPKKPTYPAARWIRMIDVDGRPQPGYAPLEETDALAAYAPFLHADGKEAHEALAADEEERALEIADGEREDDDLLDDYVLPCTVHEDGRIELDGGQSISRATVFEAYGVADPAAAPRRGRR